jgi:glycosyltransferase involved in cell wall biosynthesis
MTFVSVIIPTHNRPDLLKRAITSVIKQTYKDWELLIIDDGDELSAEPIVKSFNQNNIKYFKTIQSNSGGSVARNIGINNAKGEIVAFLDDDDEWLPEKLDAQLKIMATDSELAFSYHAVKNIYNSYDNDTIASEDKTENLYEAALRGRKFLTVTLLIKKSVLEKSGYFNESLPSNQEAELMIRISKISKGIGINKVLSIVNMRDTHEHVGSNVKRRIDGLSKTLEIHLKEYLIRPKIYAKRLFDLAILYQQDNQIGSAQRLLRKAFLNDRKFIYLRRFLYVCSINFYLKYKKVINKAPLFLGLIIIIFLWKKNSLTLTDIFFSVKNADIKYFIVAVLISLVGHIFAILRWRYILKILKLDFSYKKIFLAYLDGLPYSKIVPGGGEVGRAFFLSSYIKDKKNIFSSVLIEVLFDVLALILGITVVVSLYWNIIWPIFFLLIISLLFYLFVNLKNFVKYFDFKFIALIESFAKFKFLGLLFVSLFFHCLTAFSASMIVFSVIHQTNLFDVFLRQFLILGASLLPITVGGLGIRDILMTSFYSENIGNVLSAAVFIAIINVILPSFIGFLVYLRRFV